jgi:hypothetical protein
MRAGSLAISCEALHLPAQLAGARLGLRIEVGHAGDLDEFLLRVLGARNRIALPCLLLPILALGLRGSRGR